jgi:hypothetical protein
MRNRKNDPSRLLSHSVITVVPLALVLTLLEIALYLTLDSIEAASGIATALFLLATGLFAFDLLTAVYVARAFPVLRLRHGVKVAALVWGLQLPLLVVLVWITSGPPVLADDSVWNVAIFGWWYTGIVSIPLIGVLSACVGWVVESTRRAWV